MNVDYYVRIISYINELEEENGKLERANIMHRKLNRGVANALGLKFGDSWHDLPKKVASLKVRVAELNSFVNQLIEAGNDIAVVASDIFEFDGESGDFLPIVEKWNALVKDRRMR